jgi:hypothetical protein
LPLKILLSSFSFSNIWFWQWFLPLFVHVKESALYVVKEGHPFHCPDGKESEPAEIARDLGWDFSVVLRTEHQIDKRFSRWFSNVLSELNVCLPNLRACCMRDPEELKVCPRRSLLRSAHHRSVTPFQPARSSRRAESASIARRLFFLSLRAAILRARWELAPVPRCKNTEPQSASLWIPPMKSPSSVNHRSLS